MFKDFLHGANVRFCYNEQIIYEHLELTLARPKIADWNRTRILLLFQIVTG